MAKKAMSVTLDEANVLWLRGRARMSPANNVSETLDQLITKARLGRGGSAGPWPSVVGTVDLKDDPLLLKADAAVQEWFEEYLSQAPMVSEKAPGLRTTRKKKRG